MCGSISMIQRNTCERVINCWFKSLWTFLFLLVCTEWCIANVGIRASHFRSHRSTQLSGCPRCMFQIPEICLPMDPCGALRHVCSCEPVQLNYRYFVQFRPCVSLWSVYCGPTRALRDAIHVIHKLLHVSAPRCHHQGVTDRFVCTPLLLWWHLGAETCRSLCMTCIARRSALVGWFRPVNSIQCVTAKLSFISCGLSKILFEGHDSSWCSLTNLPTYLLTNLLTY